MRKKAEWLSQNLLEEGEKTVEFFRSLPPAIMNRELYPDGTRWRVEQIMAHFLATEIAIFELVCLILDGYPGTPENFELNRFNEKQIAELAGIPVDELIDRFLVQRQSNARMVAEFTDEQLSVEGRHPFLGIAQVEDILKLLYRHNQIHRRDIRRLMTEP